MPNHITNRLTIFGTAKQVERVLDFIKVERSDENQEVFGLGTIDFNKITPMPPWVFTGEGGYWYTWCVSNWGTKWNAYGQPDNRNAKNTIYFLTAWACPVDLIKKLSWIFPEIEVEIAWADEDLAYNLGTITFKNGEIVTQNIPEGGSLEAKKLFFAITQNTPEECGMNENYEYIDEG